METKILMELEFPALRVMVVGSFEPTYHPSESRRRAVCMPLLRGSLKRGFFERFHLLSQVHRPPHTAKRGLSTRTFRNLECGIWNLEFVARILRSPFQILYFATV